MFTGIVEEIGTITSIQRRSEGFCISIESPHVSEGLVTGESVSVNGVCLTVVSVSAKRAFSVEVVAETLEKTNLVFLGPGDHVNLERSLRLGDRLSGHLVLGHVDGMGEITSKTRTGIGETMVIRVPIELVRYIALKGSVAVDGVSLTVSNLSGRDMEIALIPFTLKSTIIGSYNFGTKVNVEVDVIARYLERLMSEGGQSGERPSKKGLTLDFLKEKWL